jgi:PAS domain-containing protein
MKSKKDPSANAAELRRQAEKRLRDQKGKQESVADSQRLLHELQVHQIELEMQNKELEGTRTELEVALEKYIDLYDFAPVGYLTLGRDGIILEANLASAKLLES